MMLDGLAINKNSYLLKIQFSKVVFETWSTSLHVAGTRFSGDNKDGYSLKSLLSKVMFGA